MNTHADKTQENKSQSVSSGESLIQSSGESTFQFVDNRPEAIAQRKLQELANNSQQVSRLRAFQDMANNSPKAIQFQAMADNDSVQQRQQPFQKKESETSLPDIQESGEEFEQSATRNTRFLVADSENHGQEQVGVSIFLSALQKEVVASADAILGAIGQTSANCPYIPYWFAYYGSKDIEHIEQAIERYAPGALQQDNWEACIEFVVKAVTEGLKRSLSGRATEGVPEELPQDLHEPKTPTVSAAQEVTIQRRGNKEEALPEYTKADFNQLMATTVAGKKKTLTELFGIEPDSIGMPEEVVIESDSNIERIEGFKLKRYTPDPSRGIDVEAGRLHFRNYYGEKVWIMDYNFKDADLVEGQIRANEVVAFQVEGAEIPTEALEKIVRKNVISATGGGFFEMHNFEHNQEMTDTQFDEFMLTVNGKSTYWILNQYDYHAVGATVIITQPKSSTKEVSVVLDVAKGKKPKYW